MYGILRGLASSRGREQLGLANAQANRLRMCCQKACNLLRGVTLKEAAKDKGFVALEPRDKTFELKPATAALLFPQRRRGLVVTGVGRFTEKFPDKGWIEGAH